MNKADIVSHCCDHVVEGVLLHLDRGVGDEDQRVERGPIRRQHVVDLRVHTLTALNRQHLINISKIDVHTHRRQHPPGILLIQLLDISPPDSVKQDLCFGPLRNSLFYIESFFYISLLNSAKGNIIFLSFFSRVFLALIQILNISSPDSAKENFNLHLFCGFISDSNIFIFLE